MRAELRVICAALASSLAGCGGPPTPCVGGAACFRLAVATEATTEVAPGHWEGDVSEDDVECLSAGGFRADRAELLQIAQTWAQSAGLEPGATDLPNELLTWYRDDIEGDFQLYLTYPRPGGLRIHVWFVDARGRLSRHELLNPLIRELLRALACERDVA